MSKLSFRGKILLMLATALVALLFMAVSSLLQQRSQIIESRRELLTTAVQSAHSPKGGQGRFARVPLWWT